MDKISKRVTGSELIWNPEPANHHDGHSNTNVIKWKVTNKGNVHDTSTPTGHSLPLPNSSSTNNHISREMDCHVSRSLI